MDKTQLDQKARYQEHVRQTMPKSPLLRDCLNAFWTGGLICVAAQGILQLAKGPLGLDAEHAGCFTSIAMVFLGALFTGLGWYDQLGKLAGAGSVVPITGFANSIVSPAMEFRREGLVLGTGAKLFTVAGPVLVLGISTSILVGLLHLAFQ